MPVGNAIRLAIAQMGPNQESQSRAAIVARMVALMEEAAGARADLVVFPELAFTTYFPKRIRDDYSQFFDQQMPNPGVAPLFESAKRHGVPFYVGYAERTTRGQFFNTAIYVSASGEILHRYRKIHLPGLVATAPEGTVRVYEPRYFSHGDTGLHAFDTPLGRVGMCLCQDRRYPETYRALGLDGARLVLAGYNTPAAPLAMSQNELALRAGAYENSMFVVGVAKSGIEDGVHLIAGSCAVDPHGQVIARSSSEDDELVLARVDFAQIDAARDRWAFYARRHPDEYRTLVEPVTEDRIRSVQETAQPGPLAQEPVPRP